MAVVARAIPISRPSRISSAQATAALLVVAAFLIRLPQFGDPALMIDEQFYLLVGDRMLHGSLPFVDIWDRKPIGLFLIYAACRLLGGDGFIQYQVVATLFAAGTAIVVSRIARLVSKPISACIAGLLYLLWIELPEGGGGQSPVFYNLFVAGAALLTLRAISLSDAHAFRIRAFGAMALVGIAMQVKYTAGIEGLFFGGTLAWGVLRRARRIETALIEIMVLAFIALAPTLVVFGFYAAIGQAHAFWFANFGSIFLRGATDPTDFRYRVFQAVLRLLPLTGVVVAGAWHLRDNHSFAVRRWQFFMGGWISASLVGFFSVGVLYVHYLLPVLVPLTAASAPIFARRPLGWAIAAFLAWLPANALGYPDFQTAHRRQQEIARLDALIPAEVKSGCLQIFDGPPVLYYTKRACTLGRFIFPDHLSAAIEAPAIGVDPDMELRRVLSLHPLAITLSDTGIRPPNTVTFATIRGALQRDYMLSGRAPFDGRLIDVWVRR